MLNVLLATLRAFVRRDAVIRSPRNATASSTTSLPKRAAIVYGCGAFLTVLFSLLVPASAIADKPAIDPSWADGKIVYMIGPHIIPGANVSQPNLYANAQELYLLVYPINNAAGDATDQKTLPSGYQPNCDPCYHPGLPGPFAYHDHVLTGAPGMGNNGTAGQFKGPWKIIVLVYNPAVALSPLFKPITRATDIDAAEAAGTFLPINSSGRGNIYEIETGNVLICPLVSPEA